MSEKISLSELQAVIKDSIYLAHPGFYWVTAEISEIKENSAGHCYLELVEKHPDIVARLDGEWNAWAQENYVTPLIKNFRVQFLRPAQ